MKLQKVETYDPGYGELQKTGRIKKALAVTAAATAVIGGLASCGHSLMGDVEYQPPQYDGYMSVESVSESDLTSSDEEIFTLDGDVACMP